VARLRLSPAARADLVDIRRYSIREFGGEVADAYLRGFNQAFALLREQSLVGPGQPDLGERVRCLSHRRHRIFYEATDDGVLIIRVVHHARNAHRELNG